MVEQLHHDDLIKKESDKNRWLRSILLKQDKINTKTPKSGMPLIGIYLPWKQGED